MNTLHIVTSYDEDLSFLANKLGEMGGHAERMVEQAVAALVAGDAVQARRVASDDAMLDAAQLRSTTARSW